jgi:hypothetical protein
MKAAAELSSLKSKSSMALELQFALSWLFLVLSLFRMRSLVTLLMVIPERCKALARGDVSWISWGWRSMLLIRLCATFQAKFDLIVCSLIRSLS